MPAADLTPGFFGKIPATGDFVSRRLPGDFIRFWDQFASRHLVPLLTAKQWGPDVGLRFLLGAAAQGSMAGLVLASADRIGRLFPLTIAAPVRFPSMSFPQAADAWFSAIHEVGSDAQAGRLDADELANELARFPFPADGVPGSAVRGLVFWTRPSELVEAGVEAPQAGLERVLALSREVG